MLRTLRFSQLRFRREEPPCGGMCAALMFRRFNVPAARRRPTFRRWITPGYDPGRDSFFSFFFFIFSLFILYLFRIRQQWETAGYGYGYDFAMPAIPGFG